MKWATNIIWHASTNASLRQQHIIHISLFSTLTRSLHSATCMQILDIVYNHHKTACSHQHASWNGMSEPSLVNQTAYSSSIQTKPQSTMITHHNHNKTMSDTLHVVDHTLIWVHSQRIMTISPLMARDQQGNNHTLVKLSPAKIKLKQK